MLLKDFITTAPSMFCKALSLTCLTNGGASLFTTKVASGPRALSSEFERESSRRTIVRVLNLGTFVFPCGDVLRETVQSRRGTERSLILWLLNVA